ncbi:MAG TPA: hypothetical protein H9687_07605 [Firmicutes bacterium]|nr:hypothetical protein [Bacillota bacterium]
MNYQRSYQIYIFGLVVGVILMLIGYGYGIAWMGAAGIVIFCAALVQTAFFFRCPNCHHTMEFRGRKPSACPHCGQALDWHNNPKERPKQ